MLRRIGINREVIGLPIHTRRDLIGEHVLHPYARVVELRLMSGRDDGLGIVRLTDPRALSPTQF
jgi:hypothetical protein